MVHKDESEDLNLHVNLCAERYKGIEDRFERLDSRMDKLEKKVDEIQKEIVDSSKSLKTVLITSAGTLVSGLLALLLTILMKF